MEGGKAVEEGFFDKVNNGALSRGMEANSLINAGCYDKNVKKDQESFMSGVKGGLGCFKKVEVYVGQIEMKDASFERNLEFKNRTQTAKENVVG